MDYDSILTATDSNIINRSEFCKTGKTVPDRDISMVGRSYCAADDAFVCGLFALMAVVLATAFYRNGHLYIAGLKNFFVSHRKFADDPSNSMYTDVTSIFLLVSVNCLSLSLICFSGLSETLGFSEVFGIPYWTIGAYYVIFMLFLYARAWLHSLVGWTFFRADAARSWMTSYFFINSIISYLIYPVSLICFYSLQSRQFVTWMCLIVLFLYEIAVLFKLFVNFKAKNAEYVLIFSYFCSVEALPCHVLGTFMDTKAQQILQAYILN